MKSLHFLQRVRVSVLILIIGLIGSMPAAGSAQTGSPAVIRAEYQENVPLGQNITLAITLDSVGAYPHFGGYDLLLRFDPNGLSFLDASVGSLPSGCGWEYFSYRSDTTGLIRLVAVADINNGDVHPSCYLDSAGVLADLHFTVTSNPNSAGHYFPLYFYWQDCGDNTIANVAGDTLLISNRVFTIVGQDITDNSPLPTYAGAPSECTSGSPGVIIRGVDYHHGGVLTAADTVGARASIIIGSDPEAFINEPVDLGIQYVPGPDPSQLGGFDLLVRYDPSALEFTGATPGSLLDTCAWEYFTYRADSIGSTALVRIVALADINDGHSPLCYAQEPGTLAHLSFMVPFDSSLFGLTTTVDWYWADCGDNLLTDRTGDTLFFSADVYNASGFPITADSALPSNTGAPSSCVSGGTGAAVRAIDYYPGQVRIPAGQIVDYRGDINLNGIPFEEADYNLFVDYFRFGAGIFSIDSALQIQATDVNADGLVLTLDDMIFLYEVTRGTEQPDSYVFGGYDTANFVQDPSRQLIAFYGVDSIAAAVLTFQGPVSPSLINSPPGMHLWSEFDGTTTRVVIYPDYSDSATLQPGLYPGYILGYTGSGSLLSAACADYLQQRLTSHTSPYPSGWPIFSIGTDDYASPGDTVQIPVDLYNVPSGFEMAGFNFTIQYDAGPLTLLSVQPGTLLQNCGWEVFTWRDATPSECGGDCPNGLVKIVSLADNAATPGQPSCFAGSDGQVAVMTFAVSDSDLYNCTNANVQWRWYECTDNSLSSPAGELLWPANVSDASGYVVPPVDSFPNSSGLIDSCSPGIVRSFDLQHGRVGILCTDSIDYRGDINLNGIAYEISDWVLFLNYFLYGPTAFAHPEAQALASDVNADGLALTLEDWVYLDRVIIGDALPYPRPVLSTTDTAIVTQDAATSSIRIEYPGVLTTAHFIFGGDVQVTASVPDHYAGYIFDSTAYTRVVVYSSSGSSSPPIDSLVDFPATDTGLTVATYTGAGTLIHAEVAGDGTQHIPVKIVTVNLPSCCQMRGNVNGIGGIDVSDMTMLVAYLFKGALPPGCPEAADVDGSGGELPINVADLTYLVSYIFKGGPAPAACP